MSQRFADKTVIVTGAGRGMGRAIAIAFAGEGAKVLAVSRSAAPLAETIGMIGEQARALVLDVAAPGAASQIMAAAFGFAGRVDVLINNAGISGDEAPLLTMTWAQWRAVLAVNLDAPFALAQAAAQAMTRTGGGAIVHNASIAASGVDGLYAPYSVAKAGLLALSRSLAVELAPHGIRSNCVSPGYTRTDMTTEALPALAHSGFPRVPINRLVETEEVAAAFLFLASDAASGITGANLVVDGGLTSNLYITETLPKR